MKEPIIVINGEPLSIAECMTIRVALETFAMDLSAEGLGKDEHAKHMTQGYLNAIMLIRRKMKPPTGDSQ